MIKVVMVKPGKYAETENIEINLRSFQSAVGGYIQMIAPFDDSVCIFCNEEGKLNGLEPNRVLRSSENGKVKGVICGNFFICGISEDGIGSLNEEQEKKYKTMFFYPENFKRSNGKITPC